MIQRRERPCQIERLRIRGRRGGDQANAAGAHGQRRQHGEGLERRTRTVGDILAQRQLVREEDGIEQSRFRLLRQRLVVADVRQRQRRRRRVSPGRLVVSATVDEQIQVHVAFHCLQSTVTEYYLGVPEPALV